MISGPLRRQTTTALLTALVVTLLLLVGCGDGAGGPSASPTSGPPSDPGLSPEPVPSDTKGGATAGSLAVYLLGGSSARECIVGNADWSAELTRLLGRDVRAVDLGATNQSFTADIRFVRGMDDGPTMVLIGVGLGRFTSPPVSSLADKQLTPPLEDALSGTLEIEHRYDVKGPLTVEKKQQLLTMWTSERYPLFRKNYKANLVELERLLDECRERGFDAVLLDLPLDLEIVGDRLDAPRGAYRKDSRRLATRFQIPFVSFVDDLGLTDADFYDLVHLLDTSRERWQARLSQEVAALLKAE